MKNCSLIKIFAVVVLLCSLCAVAEAGASAEKTFKFSVRIPETIYNTRRGVQAQDKKGQESIATKEIRDNRIVMVHTKTTK